MSANVRPKSVPVRRVELLQLVRQMNSRYGGNRIMERRHTLPAESREASSVALACAFTASGTEHGYVSAQLKRLSVIDPQPRSVRLCTTPAHRGERPSTEHRASGDKHVTQITSITNILVGAA